MLSTLQKPSFSLPWFPVERGGNAGFIWSDGFVLNQISSLFSDFSFQKSLPGNSSGPFETGPTNLLQRVPTGLAAHASPPSSVKDVRIIE